MTSKTPLILVVDDNRDNRALLARRLQRHNYQIEIAEGGAAALELIKDKKIDLVLLDILMRDMDGFETLKNIRRKFSLIEMPVIMLTALTDPQDMVEALNSGANDYVTKPLDMEVVLARIQTQLLLCQQHNS